jgi:hypothetical protein
LTFLELLLLHLTSLFMSPLQDDLPLIPPLLPD